MQIIKALTKAREILKKSKIKSFNIDSLILLSKSLNLTKEEIIFNGEKEINQDQLDIFFKLIQRRSKKEPISHIIGKREFFENDFIVNSQVLDPRYDSEILVNKVFDYFPKSINNLQILELGVGSGCLILSILKHYPKAIAIATDIKKEALNIAKLNAKNLNLTNKIQFKESNWFESLEEKKFDLIISNPPYIKSKDINSLEDEVKNYDPISALDGGKDGLECYRLIAKDVDRFLKKSAILILEIGQGQEEDVIKIFDKENIKIIEKAKDLNHIIRCLILKKAIEN